MHQTPKISIANEIFELSIKLNLEIKRGSDSTPSITKLREKLDALTDLSTSNLRHDVGAIRMDNLLPVGPGDLLKERS